MLSDRRIVPLSLPFVALLLALRCVIFIRSCRLLRSLLILLRKLLSPLFLFFSFFLCRSDPIRTPPFGPPVRCSFLLRLVRRRGIPVLSGSLGVSIASPQPDGDPTAL